MIKIVYLAGASKHMSDQGKGWRNEAEQEFTDAGWDTFNPIGHYDYKFCLPETEKACMNLFFKRLKKCDVVLVNLNETETSPGTTMELGYALSLGLPIVGYGNVNVYSWAYEASDVVLDSLKDAINYIVLHY